MKDLVDRTYSKNCKRQNSVGTKSKLFLKSSWERTWDHSVSAIKKKNRSTNSLYKSKGNYSPVFGQQKSWLQVPAVV